MTDIITRLLLNTKGFDANLKKSKNQTSNFEGAIKGAKKILGGLAAGLGAAKLTTSAFNGILDNGQKIGDEWRNTIFSAKESVDLFFSSLNTGDFSAFEGGLARLNEKLKDYSALLDAIDDALLSHGLISSEFRKEFRTLENVVRDNTMSFDKRNSALKKAEQIQKEYSRSTQSIANELINSATRKYQIQFPSLKFTYDDIHTYMTKINNEFSDEKQAVAFRNFRKKYEDLSSMQFSRESRTFGTGSGKYVGMVTEENEDITKQIRLFEKRNKLFYKFYLLNQEGDKKRKETIDKIQKQLGLLESIESYESRIVRLRNTMATKSKIEVIPKGSLADLDKQIAELQKKYATAPNNAARAALQKEIEKLQKKKVDINVFVTKHVNTIYTEDHPQIKVGKYSGAQGKSETNLKPPGFDPTGRLTKLPNTGDIKSPFSTDAVEENKEFKSSLDDITGAFGEMGSAIGGAAGQWISFGASIVTSVAKAIPAIMGLATANEVQGKTAKTTMVSESGKSMAAIPLVGPLLAIAAMASVIAAIAAIPKFAQGGIVPGTSFSGDKVLAGLNSGEIVLNAAQQGNIASKLLSAGENRTVVVGGEMRIRGRDLVALLGKLGRINKR